MTRRLAVCVVSLSTSISGASDEASVDTTGIRLARSRDGLRFTTESDVSFPGMESPEILQGKDGHVIALFSGGARKGCGPELYYSTSTNGGKAWSKPELAEFGGSRCKNARHADVLALDGGRFRLFYTAMVPRRKDRHRGRPDYILRSAISEDGIRFEPEPGVVFRCRGLVSPRPCVFQRDGRFELYLSDPFGRKQAPDEEPWRIARGVSRDGKRFASRAPLELEDHVHITSVVPLKKGMRAYGWSLDGIVSLTAGEDGDWKVDKGVRVEHGWDPAVARLKDGSYLMLYDTRPTPQAQPVSDPSVADASALGAATDGAIFEQVAISPGSLEGEALSSEQLLAAAEFEQEMTNDDFGLAPEPGFEEPVDYMQWYRQELVGPVEDNAFDAYAQFMLGPDGDVAPDWPELNDMLNDEDYDGQPGPWKPEDHPEWERTHQNVRLMLGQFRDASRHADYALNFKRPGDSADPTVEDRLMVNMLLPTLGPQREAARAVLADAWRAPDGKVDSDRMIDAFETVLRSAEHLTRGSTMIESLVGLSLRQLTDTQARWALEHEIFDEKQLAKALNTLRRFNPEPEDPMRYIRGEHAAALDATQYIFGGPGPNGELQADPDRAEYLNNMVGEPSVAKQDFVGLDKDDARAAVDAFNGYYRELTDQMRIGYPDVRAADIEATYERYADMSPLTKLMMPALSRYHHLRGRAHASRRATQLTYAVHLHHARTGAWPKSLDELPEDLSRTIRTDPFSGRDFGYRLSKDGPVIYTASENGLDDGGVHSPRWADGEDRRDTDSDDFVFFPPQP
jgi:hypothetical protein